MARLWLVLCCLAAACKTEEFKATNANFGGKNNDSGGVGGTDIPGTQMPEPPEAPVPISHTESFPIANARGSTDIALVVDNSGSMAPRIQKVHSELQKFTTQLLSYTNLRYAFLTYNCTGTETGQLAGLCFPTPPDVKPYVAAKVNPTGLVSNGSSYPGVGSTNPLSLLLAALCPAEQTKILSPGTVDQLSLHYQAQLQVCGRTIELQPGEAGSQAQHSFIENLNSHTNVAGTLENFFRPEAKKIIIVVSDDNPSGVNAAQFQRIFSDNIGYEFRFYAFISIPTNNNKACKNRGALSEDTESYPNLAASHLGATFSVCEESWANSFSQISVSGEKTIVKQFYLTHTPITEIESVAVDGQAIPADGYELVGTALSIKDGFLPPLAQLLEVKYKAP